MRTETQQWQAPDKAHSVRTDPLPQRTAVSGGPEPQTETLRAGDLLAEKTACGGGLDRLTDPAPAAAEVDRHSERLVG